MVPNNVARRLLDFDFSPQRCMAPRWLGGELVRKNDSRRIRAGLIGQGCREMGGRDGVIGSW